MRIRALDLDGSLVAQRRLLGDRPDLHRFPAREWGPRIRLACTPREYGRFAAWLERAVGGEPAAITLYGSGDFHHVTLALLRRIDGPFNLLILDKHPDWMRGIPFLHCGTWVRHALRLPNLRRVFHCGGELDFDNAYRVLAPWADIEARRIQVLPARRRFFGARWGRIDHGPLLDRGELDLDDLGRRLEAWRDVLARHALYVSIDKDVLRAEDAAVNWDSGFLRLDQATAVLRAFLDAAGGRLAGADLLGDWSPIALGTRLNRLCHRLDHPSPDHDPDEAARKNEAANRAFLDVLDEGIAAAPDPA
ncbi:hypothetical protein OJF2_25770 [Aquisphaera giovannonii]|uniref:Arginase family protein n=1 Tax=Aquisphaera giovannonii TaxID=406548 RepID=A0A5B9W1D8_9BACT|nr:arginase family protein [Aquisphaera giovannonii]QEH34044.1 hypothetical protein OJF2_25770 [Aquisphaera giovannonii]